MLPELLECKTDRRLAGTLDWLAGCLPRRGDPKTVSATEVILNVNDLQFEISVKMVLYSKRFPIISFGYKFV